MPFSASVFDAVVKRMLLACHPDTVLDIGPGAGKYGKMLREVEAELGKRITTTCVELDKPRVIDAFDLEALYDHVINEDATNIIRNYPAISGDIVIMGDFIEHLTKSAGRDLIEFLQYRFKHIFLVIPIDWISYGWCGHDQESHVSIWLPRDFDNFYGAYWTERLHAESGTRFLLCSVNGIKVKIQDHFVVKNGDVVDEILVGYLN